MAEAISVFPHRICLAACFSIIAISFSAAVAIDNCSESFKQNTTAAVSSYDCNTPIDKQIATDFVKFWAADALNFEPNQSEKSHHKSSLWVDNKELAQQIKRALWSGHESAPIVRGQIVSVGEAVVFDPKSAGLTINALLTRAGHDTERIPVVMHAVVSKEIDGYRVRGFQLDYVHDDLVASVVCSNCSRAHLRVYSGANKGSIENSSQAASVLNTFSTESKYSMEARFFSECVKSCLDN